MEEGLGCLYVILWLPYELWKWMNDGSRVGRSRMDREAGDFWWKFGMVGTALALIGLGAWWFLTKK